MLLGWLVVGFSDSVGVVRVVGAPKAGACHTCAVAPEGMVIP